MNSVRISLLTVWAAILTATTVTPGLSAQETAQRPMPEADVVVAVDGLSCPFCAYGLEKKFIEREEVDSVFVALDDNEVHLWLKSGSELSDEAVRETVEDAGFSPRAIRRPSGTKDVP